MGRKINIETWGLWDVTKKEYLWFYDHYSASTYHSTGLKMMQNANKKFVEETPIADVLHDDMFLARKEAIKYYEARLREAKEKK